MRFTARLSKSLLILAAAMLCAPNIATAQSAYPERTIRIVSITAAGGPADIVARVVGDKLAAVFGKPVVVESVVGAGGSLAAGQVARAAPDGHTLLMTGDAAIVTNISLYEKLTYDPVKDLAPISLIAATPNLLVVGPDVPAKSLGELVALARAEPGKLTFGHGGLGFSTHLAGEVLKSMAGIDMQQVVYRGAVTATLPDLLQGRITMCFCNISTVLPLVRDGKLRALAITSLERSPAIPELPTIHESGFPGFDVTSWFGLMAPAGTPPAIVEKLHAETAKALAAADVREKLTNLGMTLVGNTPGEFAAVIKAQIPQREKAIKASGIKLQP